MVCLSNNERGKKKMSEFKFLAGTLIPAFAITIFIGLFYELEIIEFIITFFGSAIFWALYEIYIKLEGKRKNE